jgi:hypothetical protein
MLSQFHTFNVEPTFLKQEREPYEITILSVCPLTNFETFNRFYKIQQGFHTVELDLGSIVLNPVASTIPKSLTSNLGDRYRSYISKHRTLKQIVLMDLERIKNV